MKTIHTDVALIGGGIMSATLGSLIKQLEPHWNITLCERLGSIARESSDPYNNAGTGHSALCELNYTPMDASGNINTDKAITINEHFQLSCQYWAHMVASGFFEDSGFINSVPHMSFVWGETNRKYLKKRYETLRPNTLFDTLEYSQSPETIAEWAPLVMAGRDPKQDVAASRATQGTDIDFGNLTNKLTDFIAGEGADIHLNTTITNLSRNSDGSWTLNARHEPDGKKYAITAPFVFIGAGGYALKLLQRTAIPESKGFGGFPIGGQFLTCTNTGIVKQHNIKVYGQAAVNAPPMSVPHLDSRFIEGSHSLLFGPYASFSTKFLRRGSYLDFPLSFKRDNLIPLITAGKDNITLTTYLIKEVLKTKNNKNKALRDYYPQANPIDWKINHAGQRVQVIKRSSPKNHGTLQFGTEIVTAADGSIGALLGASPGASATVPIMLELLERCFSHQFGKWRTRIKAMIPSFGTTLNDKPLLAEEIRKTTTKVLELH